MPEDAHVDPEYVISKVWILQFEPVDKAQFQRYVNILQGKTDPRNEPEFAKWQRDNVFVCESAQNEHKMVCCFPSKASFDKRTSNVSYEQIVNGKIPATPKLAHVPTVPPVQVEFPVCESQQFSQDVQGWMERCNVSHDPEYSYRQSKFEKLINSHTDKLFWNPKFQLETLSVRVPIAAKWTAKEGIFEPQWELCIQLFLMPKRAVWFAHFLDIRVGNTALERLKSTKSD